jgi:4-amino-4-deoxy-L-arabinose transferase-like glycosyltransferase
MRWEPVCAAAIVVIGAWLRLRHLGLAEFKFDEASAMRIAHGILDGHIKAVGLRSSSGAMNPPLYVYVVAVVVAIRDSVLFATATVAVLSVVAVALTYVVVRSRFGEAAALIATGLFATAPWAVLYGRHLWQQDYLPIVTVSLLWSLFVVLERDRSRAAFFAPALGLVAVQLNFSAVALVVPIAAVFVYRRRDVHWRAAAIGLGVGVLPLLPWLASNVKHRFSDFSLIAESGSGHGAGTVGAGTIEAIRQTIHLISAEGWSYVVGPHHEPGIAYDLGRIGGIVTIVLLAVGIVTSLATLRRRDIDAARRALLIVWLVAIWLAYIGSSRGSVFPHYLIVSYPVSFVLAALGLTDLTGLVHGRAGMAAALLAGSAIAAAFVAFSVSFQHFVQQRGGTAGDYGVIYDDTAALAKVVKAHHLQVDDPAAEYLVSGQLSAPPDPSRDVTTRDRLVDPPPLPCGGTRRSFGPVEACFPH